MNLTCGYDGSVFDVTWIIDEKEDTFELNDGSSKTFSLIVHCNTTDNFSRCYIQSKGNSNYHYMAYK